MSTKDTKPTKSPAKTSAAKDARAKLRAAKTSAAKDARVRLKAKVTARNGEVFHSAVTKGRAKAKKAPHTTRAYQAKAKKAPRVQQLTGWRDAVATCDTELGFTDWIECVGVQLWKNAVANDKTLLGYADWAIDTQDLKGWLKT